MIDQANLLMSSTYSVTSDEPVWTFTDIVVCDELDDFIAVSLDGAAALTYTPNVNFGQGLLSYWGYSEADGGMCTFLWVRILPP